LLGVPLDENSSYKRGSAAAPPLIRDALRCVSSNMWSELGVDVGAEGAYVDAGDLPLPQKEAFREIENSVEALLARRKRPVCLGGDHSITYPIVRAFGRHFKDLTIIHFDAHPDLYDDFQGNRHSHASPFARIMEEKLAKRFIQVCIRAMNPAQKKQATRFGVEVYEIGRKRALEEVKTWCPVYVSFDMDVLDPAFAPGVSHREPGGMSVREVLEHLHSITATIVGADIVEYNPSRDVSDLTAAVAGKILKELLGKMLMACNCP
jgi:agmatinase